jgi:tetratricopeptide (TPR) repeat protein
MMFRRGPGGRVALLALALAVAVATLYLPSAGFDFFLYDDETHVWGNPVVGGGFSPRGIAAAFSTVQAQLWVPLTWISYQVYLVFFGPGPFGHHLINILLHAANAGLLLFLLFRLTGAVWRSALAAALWALHPLRVESVAWISERKDVLSVFFLLLALFAYERRVRTGSRGWYVALLSSFAAGLLSKPMLVTFPVLLLILDYWPLRRMGGDKGWSRPILSPLLKEKIPFCLMAAAVSTVTLITLRTGDMALSVAERLQRAALSGLEYLEKTFWPRNLHFAFDYSFRDHPGAGPTAAAVLVLVLVSILAWRARRGHAAFFAGWTWYLAALLPVSGLLATGGQLSADRFTYLPHLLLVPALVWTAAGLLPSLRRYRITATAAALLLLLVLAVLTRQQLPVWTDSESVFVNSLRVKPHDLQMRKALGEFYLQQGRPVEAEREFRTLIATGPDLAPGRLDLAEALLWQGKREETSAQLTAALSLPLEGPLIRYNLAVLLIELGRREEAAALLIEALRLDPADEDARSLLGRLGEEK